MSHDTMLAQGDEGNIGEPDDDTAPIEIVDGVFAGAPMTSRDADTLRSFIEAEARKRLALAPRQPS